MRVSFWGWRCCTATRTTATASRFEPLFDLLSEKDLMLAEVLGKAMRFGSMLSADDPGLMGTMRWFPQKKRLELRLPDRARGLFGEVAEARLRTLASALQAEAVVKIQRAQRKTP